MKYIKKIGIFFGTFVIYHIIFSGFFPVDENNVLQAPDWYTPLGMGVSIVASIFLPLKRKTKASVATESTQDSVAINDQAPETPLSAIDHATASAPAAPTLAKEKQETAPAQKEAVKTGSGRDPKNPNLLSDGRRVPPFAQLQQPIATRAIKSARSCRDLANKSTSVADFLHWYDQLLIDFEDLSKLNKVSFTTPPSHDLYKLREEFQLHLCDAIVRAKEEALGNIRGKYRNSKEFQEIALTSFIDDIERDKDRFSPWTEELAKKSVEEVKKAVHSDTYTPQATGNEPAQDFCYDAQQELYQEDEVDALTPNAVNELSYTDEMFPVAVDAVLETGQTSVSTIQRQLKLGYGRASRIVDEMEENGIVGKFQGSTPREILITKEKWKLLKRNAKYVSSNADYANTEIKKSIVEAENAMLKAKLAVALAEKENLERSVKKELEDKITVAKAELLTIDLMEGHDFENWCAEALRNSGFTNVTVTPGSGDQGVDVVAEKDGLKYAVQCKRYNSDLGNAPVQEVFTGARFYNCQVGVVMTNRNFTTGAKDAAAVTGVLLWGRSWILQYLYKKHGVMPEADLNE